MSADRSLSQLPRIQVGVVAGCALVIGLTLAWGFLGMRAVLGIGGTCATGGPYVVAQDCPGGAAALLSLAFPLLAGASLAATFLGAPRLLLVMWALLFGSLGWNFFEYGVADELVVTWLICGVVFWAMAAPAAVMLAKGSMSTAPSFDGTDRSLADGHLALVAGPLLVAGIALGGLTFWAWA